MIPPWIKFPARHPSDLFWRMGDGEAYLFDWCVFLEQLSASKKRKYFFQNCSPLVWRSIHCRDQALDDIFRVLRDLEDHESKRIRIACELLEYACKSTNEIAHRDHCLELVKWRAKQMYPQDVVEEKAQSGKILQFLWQLERRLDTETARIQNEVDDFEIKFSESAESDSMVQTWALYMENWHILDASSGIWRSMKHLFLPEKEEPWSIKYSVFEALNNLAIKNTETHEAIWTAHLNYWSKRLNEIVGENP